MEAAELTGAGATIVRRESYKVQMRLIAHPEAEQLHLAQVLHALSDPVRLEIVTRLGECPECSCGKFEVSVSKSTLTHHLKVLRDAGLTRTRTEGVQRLVSLRREDLDKRFPGLLDLVFAHAAAAQDPCAGKAE